MKKQKCGIIVTLISLICIYKKKKQEHLQFVEGKMDKKINDFIVFCIENYKEKERLISKEIFKLFEDYKVLDYLKEGAGRKLSN